MQYQVISFDMQQNLPTPHIHTSLVFYLCQLWVYNFGIHDCSTGTGFMCMWSENVAKRGSDEVASSLLCYFKSLISRPKHLIAYSDSVLVRTRISTSCAFGSTSYFTISTTWSITNFLCPAIRSFLRTGTSLSLKRRSEKERWYRLVEETRSKSPFRVA